MIEDESYFRAVSRTIHPNPIRAGLVARPEDSGWSSDPVYVSAGGGRPWVRYEALLAAWRGDWGGDDAAGADRRKEARLRSSPQLIKDAEAIVGLLSALSTANTLPGMPVERAPRVLGAGRCGSRGNNPFPALTPRYASEPSIRQTARLRAVDRIMAPRYNGVMRLDP